MKSILKKKINKVVKDLFKIPPPDYSIEIPMVEDFGDYSTNIAFILAKKLKRKPQDVANKIVGNANLRSLREFSKIETAGGGFINFSLSPSVLIKELKKILKEKDKYGDNNLGKGRKIQLEFISANPTGPLTVGNGRGGFFGDTLANILRKSGFNVQKEYYVNDAGRQVRVILAKSIRKSLGLDVGVPVGSAGSVPNGIEEIYGGDYIDRIARKIRKEKGIKWIEAEYERCGELAAKIILEELIKKDLKFFNIKFDEFKHEGDFFIVKSKEKLSLIERMWKKLTKKGFIYEKEGAYWLKTSEFGDEKDRVVKTTEGEFTYLMSDIAYLYDRFALRKFDKVVVIVGADHHGYIDRWKAAAEMLGYRDKLEILITQLVRLVRGKKEVKMSKRKGIFITLREIVEEISLDAARYFFISRDLDSHMDIDLDLAKEESTKNPIYYIQYASARINSVFRKIKVKNQESRTKNFEVNDISDQHEINLIKKLIQFPDIVEEIAKTYEAQKIAIYTLGLAETFHKFYENCRIIGDEREKQRLAILTATKIVLGNCLGLMGIKAVEKM